MNKRAAFTILLVLILTSGLVATGSNRRASASTTVPTLRVLLLGDSYMAGNGAREILSDGSKAMDFYGPDLCFRSRANWGEQWAKDYTNRTGVPVYLENHACAGATAVNDFYHTRSTQQNGKDPTGVRVWIPYVDKSQLTDSYIRNVVESRYPCGTDVTDDSDRPGGGDVRWVEISPFTMPYNNADELYVTATCHTDIHKQGDWVDQSWDVVLLSLGGNDVDFGPIVQNCFVPLLSMLSGQACADAIMSPDAVEQKITDRFSLAGTENVYSSMQQVLSRMRSDAKLIYVGYPGLELDRNFQVWAGGNTPIGARIQYLQNYIEQRQQMMVDAANATYGSGKVRFVKMRELSVGHENTGNRFRDETIAPPDATTGINPWQWDTFENALWNIDDVGRGGQDFYYSFLPPEDFSAMKVLLTPSEMLHMNEYYHYNPTGHAVVGAQVHAQSADVGLSATGSSPGALPRGLTIHPTMRSGACVLSTRWSGVYSVGLQVTVTGPDGSSYDAVNGGGCLNLQTSLTANLDVHVVIPEYSIDVHWARVVKVTDDGDDIDLPLDNCPGVGNQQQDDYDADGIGDHCDPSLEDSVGIQPDPTLWASPIRPRVFGDPHLVTLDGLAYDFQAAGEFTLMRVPSRSLELQARMEPVSTGGVVSWTSSTAVGLGQDRVEVRTAANGSVEVLVNSVANDLNSPVQLSLGGVAYRINGQIVVQTYRGIVLSFSSGIVGIKVAPGLATSGLLGNHDGSEVGDLQRSDGVVVEPSDRQALYSAFADSWRVAQGASLFTYSGGLTTDSYTDKTFPPNVVKLADFTPAELDAANASCVAGGVGSGWAMEACALDVLVTAGNTFVSAAATAAPGIDSAAVAFTPSGLLRQTFDGNINSQFAAQHYVRVDSTSAAAGPVFDEAPYKFALVSVPRHSQTSVSAKLLVIGGTESDSETQTISVDVDAVATAVVRLEGSGQVQSGPSGSTVAFTGTGTLVDGTAFRSYEIVVPVAHATDAMKVTLSPSGFHAVLGTGMAIDSVQVQLVTLPADVKSALTLPFTAGSVQGPAFGAIDLAGGADEYRFTLAATTDVLLESAQASSAVRIDLVNTATGEWVAPSDRNYHQLYRGLPAGSYSVVVTAAGQTVSSYAFQAMVAPPAQQFSMNAGDAISDGLIGGVAVAGAGNLDGTFPVWWRVGHISRVPDLGRNRRWDRHGGRLPRSTKRQR